MRITDAEAINQQPLAAIELAKSLGWDHNNLTPSQHHWLAIKLRSTKQLFTDAGAAIVSMVATRFKLRVVPLPIAHQNETQCRSNECGMFVVRTDNQPICLVCQCGSNGLRSKWIDAAFKCVKTNPVTGLPFWDNTKVNDGITEVNMEPSVGVVAGDGMEFVPAKQ